MDKHVYIRICIVLIAVAFLVFAWLCLTAFGKPQCAAIAFAVSSFLVGYLNGRR